MLEAIIMQCYRHQGFGALIILPICGYVIDCIGTSFVDDADLYAWLPALKTSAEVWQEMQSSIKEWGSLLISTGEALKPDKCYWYNIGYKFLCNGPWIYKDNAKQMLTVPLPDGSVPQYDTYQS